MIEIRPDVFHEITLHDTGREFKFRLNAKYDRIDVFRPLGMWILKVFDDELGFVQAVVDEEQADKLIQAVGLPLIEREFIYKSEHELVLDAMVKRLDDSILDDE